MATAAPRISKILCLKLLLSVSGCRRARHQLSPGPRAERGRHQGFAHPDRTALAKSFDFDAIRHNRNNPTSRQNVADLHAPVVDERVADPCCGPCGACLGGCARDGVPCAARSPQRGVRACACAPRPESAWPPLSGQSRTWALPCRSPCHRSSSPWWRPSACRSPWNRPNLTSSWSGHPLV